MPAHRLLPKGAPPPLAIVGTTASGKSSLAMALARHRGDVELVSVDSMQVYRGMDIGTAKPTAAEQAEVRHHVIDLVDPWEPFEVHSFQQAVGEALRDIAGRDRRAVLVGGTGLYLQAVIDGFEIPGPPAQAGAVARALLAQPGVKPAGLGARDTLRLEAGLCLYGHDIDTTTSPIEAGLQWAIQKVRRPGGARAGGYPGAAAIESQLASSPPSVRVGLLGLERVPVREGASLVDAHGRKLGRVTSGTLAPTVNQPIAMAYLPRDHARAQHEVYAEVRGRRLPMRVVPLPFTPHHYKR